MFVVIVGRGSVVEGEECDEGNGDDEDAEDDEVVTGVHDSAFLVLFPAPYHPQHHRPRGIPDQRRRTASPPR